MAYFLKIKFNVKLVPLKKYIIFFNLNILFLLKNKISITDFFSPVPWAPVWLARHKIQSSFQVNLIYPNFWYFVHVPGG